MKVSGGKQEMDLGGEAHLEGDFLFQIQDGGVSFQTADDSSKQTLIVKSSSVKVIDGPAEAVGGVMMDFITLITKSGDENQTAEAQVAALLAINDLGEKFAEKYGDDVTATDSKFIDGLKLKLPGCTFGGRVKHSTYQERVSARFAKIWNPKMQLKAAGEKKTETNTPQNTRKEEKSGDDW